MQEPRLASKTFLEIRHLTKTFPGVKALDDVSLSVQRGEIHALYFRAGQLLEELGLYLNPRTPIKNLGLGQQQLVEIAKALSKNARLLILDEPSAALTEKEVQILMRLLGQLRERGVTCLYISHKISEVLSIRAARW
jgi:ABC-type sugar transport system ATPase subunit